MDWVILILGVPAVLIPLVLLFGFAGCHPATPCFDDSDCPGGSLCNEDGQCVPPPEPGETIFFPPSAPENLSATAIDDHSVLLTWASNEAGATFKIERAQDGDDNFQTIVPTRPVSPAGTIDDTPGLLEGVTFLYRVSALVDQGASEPTSSVASDISSATVLPATPGSFTATPVSINQIDLSWTNRSTVATEFSLERRVVGGTFAPIGPVRVTGNTFSDTIGLSGGTTYEYQVFAVMDGVENSQPQVVKSLPALTAPVTTLAFTTAFTATLTTDQAGTQAICLVQRLRSSLLAPNLTVPLTGTQVRITLGGPSTGSITLDRIFISTVGNTGDPYDSAGDLTDLVPGGGVTTLTAGSTVTLGPVNYPFDSRNDLLIAFDISGTQGPFNLPLTPVPGGGADQFGQFGLAEAGTQDRSPNYLVANNILYFIEKIEVL